MKSLSAALLLSGAVVAAAFSQSSTPRHVITAVPTTEQITVDGFLGESAWQGPSFSAFSQRDPNQGEPPTERTEVWVAYDDQAVYVAARLYDSSPDSIMRLLGRRDAFITADWFAVFLDPYHDRRTGYFFALSASGTMSDGTLFNDDWDDDSWDGVWEGETRIHDRGWDVEIRIPFTQLRFHENKQHVWGINFKRIIGRKNEQDYLVYTPRNESGFVSRFADLTGISSISSGNQVELLPYLNTRAEYVKPAPGDPFNSGARYLPGVGADLKVGLTSNLTLDATVNPDFGQVEVDPAVINLSDVETFFSEKRPFFIEGANVFEFGFGGSNDFWGFNWANPRIFYSRRIGRSPQGSLPSYDYVDRPLGTHILGAGKLTGRMFDQWKVGTIHAVTNREFAEIQSTGQRSSVEIEPLTYYGIGRVQRDFDEGRQGLGFIGTFTRRSFSDQRLRDELNSEAMVAGMDGWTFLDEEKTYVITGWGAMSTVRGSEARMTSWQRSSVHYFQRPDASHLSVDSNATSMTGYAGRLLLNKQKGPLAFNAALGAVSPHFDVNDVGFLGRADMINGHVMMGYRWKEPTDVYRQLRLHFSTFGSFDFQGNRIWHGYWTNGSIQFTNYYWFFWGAVYNPFTINNRKTRGGPLMLNHPGKEFFMGVESDSRKDVVVNLFGYTYLRSNEPSFGIDASVEWKPLPSISVRLNPSIDRNASQAQYVTVVPDVEATRTFGSRYVFATLNQTTISAAMRLNWTFTPKLSLQLYVQPLISAGDYSGLKELYAPKTFDFLTYGQSGSTITEAGGSYQVDPDGPGPAAPFTVSNPDFNITSIRGNAILRWEYRPGSTLYLVWTRSSSGFVNDGTFRFSKSFDRLIEAETDNILMLKFTYWFSM